MDNFQVNENFKQYAIPSWPTNGRYYNAWSYLKTNHAICQDAYSSILKPNRLENNIWTEVYQQTLDFWFIKDDNKKFSFSLKNFDIIYDGKDGLKIFLGFDIFVLSTLIYISHMEI